MHLYLISQDTSSDLITMKRMRDKLCKMTAFREHLSTNRLAMKQYLPLVQVSSEMLLNKIFFNKDLIFKHFFLCRCKQSAAI
jgi:hypothetical protein